MTNYIEIWNPLIIQRTYTGENYSNCMNNDVVSFNIVADNVTMA